MGLGSALLKFGSLIKKGGKWAFNHAEQISDAVEAGHDIHSNISDIKKKKADATGDAEYCQMLETENENLVQFLNEIQNNILVLGNAFESTVNDIEQKYEEVHTEIKELRLELNTQVTNLQNQLEMYRKENAIYQQKQKKRLLICTVALCIGVVTAIVLAILL